MMVAFGLVGTQGGLAVALISWTAATPQYTASAQTRLIVVGEPRYAHPAVQSAFRQAEILADLATSAPQLGKIGRLLDPPAAAAELMGVLTARKEPELLVISIMARHDNADRAAEIANAAAEILVSSYRDTSNDAGSSMELIASATPSGARPHPHLPRNLIIGAVAGAALGLAIATSARRRRDREPATGGSHQVADRSALAAGSGIGLAIIASLALQLPEVAVQALAGLAAVVAILSPGAGLAILAATLPMREPPGFVPIGFPAVLIGATAFGVLLTLLARGARLRLSALMVMAVGYVAMSAVSAVPGINGTDGERTVQAVARLIQVGPGLVLIALSWWYFSRYDARPHLVIAVVAAALAGALGILQAAGPNASSNPLPGLIFTPPDAVEIARATGPFFNPNYYGFFLALGLVLVLSLAANRGWSRLTAIAAVPIGAGLLLTFSRGALVAAGAGLVAVVWTRNRTAGIAMLILAIVLMLTIIPIVLNERTGAEYVPTASNFGDEVSDQGRLGAMLGAFPVWLRDPVFGVGFGQYAYESAWFVGSSSQTSSHNEYLSILAEQGIIGFIIFGALAVGLAARIVSAGGWARPVGIASLTAFAVGSGFIEPLASLQTSGVMWLTLGAVCGASVRAKRPVDPAHVRLAHPDDKHVPEAVRATSG